MSDPTFDDKSPYAGLRFSDVGGYMRATVKGHPIADGRGRVRLHRAVLFDAIGDGPHVCLWCGWDGLRWDVKLNDPDYLVVDHVDGDGYNNTTGNLVASHKWCNDNRGVIEQLGIPWETIAELAPGDRPNLRSHGGEPNAAALELAGRTPADPADVVPLDNPPPASAPLALNPVPSPPADRSWWRRRAVAAHPAGGGRIGVTWGDVVDVDELGRGNVRLRPPPEWLLEKYPKLRAIDWSRFGR